MSFEYQLHFEAKNPSGVTRYYKAVEYHPRMHKGKEEELQFGYFPGNIQTYPKDDFIGIEYDVTIHESMDRCVATFQKLSKYLYEIFKEEDLQMAIGNSFMQLPEGH